MKNLVKQKVYENIKPKSMNSNLIGKEGLKLGFLSSKSKCFPFDKGEKQQVMFAIQKKNKKIYSLHSKSMKPSLEFNQKTNCEVSKKLQDTIN